MPFINTKLSIPLDSEKEQILKESLGRSITLIGKSEAWLMLNFEDNCRLWFKGEADKPTAMVEVSLYGKASRGQYDSLTAEITDVISSVTGIEANRIYVKYSETDTWGFCGSNF